MKQERHLGTFGVAPALEKTGELLIDGRNTRLKLFGTGLEYLEDALSIYGRTDRNLKASCFECIPATSALPFFNEDSHVERIELRPGFVLIGAEHLRPDESEIVEARFKFTDTQNYFENKRLFGTISDVAEDLQKVLDKKRPGSGLQVGAGGIVSYFAGDYNIVEVPTKFGIFLLITNSKLIQEGHFRIPLIFH